MPRRHRICLSLWLAATALAAPGTAFAQSTPREAELEARLAKLEAEMQALRADLVSARGEQAETAAVAQQGRVRQGGVISAVAVGHRQAALAVMCRG